MSLVQLYWYGERGGDNKYALTEKIIHEVFRGFFSFSRSSRCFLHGKSVLRQNFALNFRNFGISEIQPCHFTFHPVFVSLDSISLLLQVICDVTAGAWGKKF